MPDLSVRYAHAWESMAKGIDEQGPFYAVVYRFDSWSDSDSVINQLRGSTRRSGSTVYRTLPHTHPLSPNLSCTSAVVEGIGAPVTSSSGLPSYDNGFLVRAIYRPLPWLISNDPTLGNQIDPTTPITTWCTQELDYETEVIPFNEDNQYTYTAGGTDYTGIPVKAEVQITNMVLTFHQLPYLPTSTIRSLRNKINSSTFLGASTETVRFINARTTVDYNTDGTTSQKVQLVFKERDVSWNKVLKKDGTWAYIYNSSSNTLFSTADLTPLINL